MIDHHVHIHTHITIVFICLHPTVYAPTISFHLCCHGDTIDVPASVSHKDVDARDSPGVVS
jgi:hypothetical protein